MAASAASLAYVQKMFLAYFGRPVAPTGQDYYAGLIDAGNVAALQDDFWNSTESQNKFKSLTTEGKVTAIFQQLFGRDPAVSGLTYWTTQINSGAVTLPAAALTILNSAAGDDLTVFNAKLKVAEAFTAQLDTSAEVLGLQNNTAGAVAVFAAIKTTAAADAAVADIVNVVKGVVEAVGSTPGQTFTLTTSADNIVGTSGNDTVGGVNAAGVAPQFSLVDAIDGGAGVDTLKLQLNAAYTGGATIKNVEKLQVSLGGNDFSANGIAGLTDVELLAEGDSYSALGNVVNMAVTGVAGAGGGATTFTFADAAVAGSSDAAKLTLNNVATAATSTVNINNTTATTGNTGLETLTVDLAGVAGSATAGTNVTLQTNATQSLTTLKVTGASAGILNLAANPAASVTTIDASAATGGVTVTGIGATNTTVTGGSGNDAFVFGVGNFTTADVVDGGAGTDTLGAGTANLAAVTAVNANVKNIETIRVVDDLAAGASVINLANFGATNVRIAGQALGGAETLTINNLGSTSNVRLDAAIAANILTLNVKDAALPGTADHVTFDLRGATGGGDTYNATMAGVETVTVNLSNAGSAQTLVLGDAALATLNVVNTGAQNFITNFQTAGTNTAVSKVDLSGVTGTGTNSVTLVAASTTGAQVTGSANVDTIVATNNVDVINAGAGNDQITGLNGGDRINVGTGTDNVIYTAAAETFQGAVTSGTTVLTGVDVITGMGVGDTLTVFAAADITAATAISTSLLAGPGAVDTIALVKGSYNADTGIFTASTTGTDTLVQWDSNGDTAAGALESVVLVGFAGTASTVGANLITLG